MPQKMPTEFANVTQDTSPTTENVWNAPQPVPPAHQPPTAIPASKTKTLEALLRMAVHVWTASMMMESTPCAQHAVWSAAPAQGPSSTA